MDTVTHALLGIAAAGLSGHSIALSDPVYIASVLGAQAPDFDIITQIKGNMNYLKHHRFISHSIPGIALWSALISIVLHAFLPDAAIGTGFLWAFAGGLSHIAIDYFNTHGASVLWPFRQKRLSCHLLNVFDPVLIILMLSLYLYRLPIRDLSALTFLTIALYIGFRAYLRHRSTRWLARRFANQTVQRVLVMPSLKRIFFWDFVVETDHQYLVGEIGALYPVLDIKAHMPKQHLSQRAARAKRTRIGRFFRKFTPFVYFAEKGDAQHPKVQIYDLRYYHKKFLHTATVVFNEENIPCESYIDSLGQIRKIPC